jgi:NAD(P)-dependent dehydrogenase (short-subunit alcohol dehydrogenase family)
MTALVTGAAKRLGRAMALRLAERGHDVAVHYAGSAEEAEATVSEIRALGRNAVAVQADLTIEDETQALLPRAAEALGQPITVLVNNASIFEYDNIRSATRESWDRHLESNLRAPFVLSQALAAQVPEAARRERRAFGARPDRQHDRPARPQADAGIHELHDREDGAMGPDADIGTGAGPPCPGERHWSRADDAGRAPVRGPFRAAARGHDPRSAGPIRREYAPRSTTCCRRGP